MNSRGYDWEAIRRDYPLEAIVAKSIKLRPSGATKVACCPFHNEKTPSFHVYPDNSYHCFGCGAHGDVIDFVAKIEHVEPAEAIRRLTGGVAPSLSPDDFERRRKEQIAADKKREQTQQRARQAAKDRWDRATPINGVPNGYCERKGIAPYGCRQEGECLIVPIFDAAGEILSVQSIPPDAGEKKLFHPGAVVTKGRLTLGDNAAMPIVVVEGFATGASVQAATGWRVCIAFSKANVAHIVRELVEAGDQVVIGADTNAEAEMQALAEETGARLVLPDLQGADGTDFNDQAGHYGLVDVAQTFLNATEIGEEEENSPPSPPQEKVVWATPFIWRDAAQIPKRQWLYGKHLLRKFVSVDVAAGGIGKSSLKIGEALAMASGRDLYNKGLPEGAITVWLWNLEDPHEEIERRIHATCQRYRIQPQEIGDRLYVDSGRDQPLVIATEGPDGAIIARPVVDALIAEMIDRKIDVLTVDPFISSHAVSENDNNAIDIVAREWNVIAERTGAAINLVHHVRKQNGAEATADSARGASALIGKARSVIVYNRMTKEEANNLGVDESDRRFMFRVDNDKANLAPPDATDWYRMNNVDLENGDSVGVACSWTPPDALDGINIRHLVKAQQIIGEGKYREHDQSPEWAGHAIGHLFDLDTSSPKDKARVKKILRTWIMNGAMEVVIDRDKKGNERKFIVVGEWVAE